jgi:aryl-alcohol dehydrogenase-like predicted oxidoreductase
MNPFNRTLTRREAIKTGVFAGVGLTLGGLPSLRAIDKRQLPLITKPIPSSGEQIPVVGVGTNRYSVNTAEEMAPLRDVLRRLPQLGGSVIDTAPGYRRSEIVIGELVEELGNRDQLFLATKVTANQESGVEGGIAMLEESFRRLKTDRIDLMQVHNLRGTDVMLPVLREWKQEGRIRYIGITTSSDRQYEQMLEIMRRETLDFIQVDYSIGNRNSAEEILPLAQEKGMAVLLNLPFGGRRGSVFSLVADKELPEWAAEIDCHSWAQFVLKYNVSHPAVTCAIPGTTKLNHVEDNNDGARGRLPDAAMRRRMEQYWDAM